MKNAHPFAVGQQRADHFTEQAGVHQPVFVEHAPVKIDTAQGVGIVRAIDTHLRAIHAEIQAEFGFIHGHAVHRGGVVFQIVPGDRLAHPVGRGDVRKTGRSKPDRMAARNQVIDGENRLPEAAMADSSGEAMRVERGMEDALKRARRVRQPAPPLILPRVDLVQDGALKRLFRLPERVMVQEGFHVRRLAGRRRRRSEAT